MVEDIPYFLELHIAVLESSWLGGESENHGKKTSEEDESLCLKELIVVF